MAALVPPVSLCTAVFSADPLARLDVRRKTRASVGLLDGTDLIGTHTATRGRVATLDDTTPTCEACVTWIGVGSLDYVSARLGRRDTV